MSAADELDVLRSFRADIGVLDTVTDLRIRARIHAGLVAAAADDAAAPEVVRPEVVRPEVDPREVDPRDAADPEADPLAADEYGLYLFDPAPTEADLRSDTPATLRPRRPRRSAPGARAPRAHPAHASPLSGGAPARVQPSRAEASPDRGPSSVRRVAAVAAALVLVVAGAVAIVRTRAGDRGPAPGLDAAAAPLSLPELETLLRSQPRRDLAPGQFQHTHVQVGERRDSVTGAVADTPQFVTQDRARWVAADGSGREFLGPELARPFDDPAAPVQDIGNSVDVPLQQPKGFAGLSSVELQALPTDPTALRQRLLDSGALVSRDVSGLARMTGQLLEQPLTPPDVRAALLVMLEADGLRSVGDRTDRSGRRGSGFELEADGRRTSYIVDRATGALLAWEQRELPSGLPLSDSLTVSDGVAPVTDDTGGG